jgi:hypothetical protein
MAEAMTVETIVEAEWQMKGYWTRLRFPLQTPKGGWSDIDLVAYNPEDQHLVIAESKVRGPKKEVYAFTKYTQERYGDILTYDDDNYFGFLRHIGFACADGAIFKTFRSMVKTLTVQLVSNYYISEDVKEDAERSVRNRIANDIPSGVKLRIQLETTLDLILRIMINENSSGQGRRYGHPAIDIAREINRYLRPNIRYAGRGAQAIDTIKKDLAKQIRDVFLVEDT